MLVILGIAILIEINLQTDTEYMTQVIIEEIYPIVVEELKHQADFRVRSLF